MTRFLFIVLTLAASLASAGEPYAYESLIESRSTQAQNSAIPTYIDKLDSDHSLILSPSGLYQMDKAGDMTVIIGPDSYTRCTDIGNGHSSCVSW